MATPKRFLEALSQIRREVKRLEADYYQCQLERDEARRERDEALTLVLRLQNELDEANERIARLQKWDLLG